MRYSSLFFLLMASAVAQALPVADCPDTDLCALGSGQTLREAQTDARAEIAKIFETKVDSSLELTTTSDSEHVKEIVTETTEMLLKATRIPKTFLEDGVFYALAVLPKEKALHLFVEEMKTLDDEIDVLIKSKSAAKAKKALSLYKQRMLTEQRYQVISDKPYPAFRSYAELAANFIEKRDNSPFMIETDDDLHQAVQEAFIEQGFAFTDKGGIPLEATLRSQEISVSMPGFKRFIYRFTLKMNHNTILLTEKFEIMEPTKQQADQVVLGEIQKILAEKTEEMEF